MRTILTGLMLLICITVSAQVETIRYINLERHIEVNTTTGVPTGYVTVSAQFRIPIPATLIGNENVSKIADTYKSMYKIDHLDTVDAITYAVFMIEPISMNIYKVVNGVTSTSLITDIDIQQALETEYNVYVTKFGCFQLFPFDGIINKSKIGSSWVDSPQ